MLNARRGTVLWAIDHFRNNGLQALINDLRSLEDRGLNPSECNAVQDALAEVVAVAAEVPQGTYWQSSIYGEFERFLAAYIMWNGHKPEGAVQRRAELGRIRIRKQAIARRVRAHKHHLASLDRDLVVRMYRALERIPKQMPPLFPKVAAAAGRFKSGLV